MTTPDSRPQPGQASASPAGEPGGEWFVGTVGAWRAVGYVVGLPAFMVGTAIFMVGFALCRPGIVEAGCYLYAVSILAIAYRVLVFRYAGPSLSSWIRPVLAALAIAALGFGALAYGARLLMGGLC